MTCGSHKTIEFSKSKAMLGSINAVERSRVSDLQNPEEDRPLAPHWRATRCQLTVCSQLFIARVPCLYSNPGPTTGHWGYTGGDPKAPGWVGAGRSTAGVAGGLPAEQVTGLIPNVFPKHYVVFEKIRILFIVFVQTNPAVKFKSEVCGVVMGLHQDATASAGGGPESPGVSLHGSFHG